ncbi:clusterin associated protein 1 [Dermatophagoides farinae]|uniref:Clusterin-associated protein 1-like protein n=1 Tax=Dermatophagoides farinae TaxID=6954 RepID=A0A9D4SBP5_DERFA|nr:clusterin-associated protein 1 homolog [Dermatophagoides farinae]KAH7636607.1 clusterin-associated protein 1-like protein [Dermatophagoides farinae]
MASSNYHLMRNFISVMRSLGYPRQMSIENFRNPNFPLMADVLVYLLKRFDPKTEIETNVETEEGRLKFVMTASHLMVNKANLDINVKKLYMADVNSVQEMIKLAKLIQEAWITLDQDYRKQGRKDVINEEDENDSDESKQSLIVRNGEEFDRTKLSQYNSFKTSQITSEIYQVATKLYDTIAEHDQNKDQLQKTLGKQLVIDQIESQIRQSIRQLQQDIVDMQQRKQNVDRDNDDINGKIEKKQSELNRNKKRLQTLHAQRPGYQDELEKIEQEIVGLYDDYVTSSRCLYFLEQKLEEFEELERLKIEERNKEIKQMLEQIKIDDFLKTNKDMRINSWNQQNIGTDERSADELAAIVDVDEDAMGRVSDGSDFSDRDINEIPKNDNHKSRRNGRQKANKLSRTNDKKDRLLMANTVVKSQRSPVSISNDNTLDTSNNRSAKTARIFSYGSLLENDDDDDDDDDDDSERSETNAKMSDSEIDLDAIDSEDDDEDSINSTEVDFTKSNETTKIATNSEIKISASNLDKGDDDF